MRIQGLACQCIGGMMISPLTLFINECTDRSFQYIQLIPNTESPRIWSHHVLFENIRLESPSFQKCSNHELFLWLCPLAISIGPIVEECLFRGLIQDAILYRGVKKAFYPHIHSVDMRIWTVARILIGSSMFALAHISGYEKR